MKVKSARARRTKTEHVDIKKSENFSFPPRDLGHIPSLNRPVIKPKSPSIIKGKEKLTIDQELEIMSTKPTIIPPKNFPTNKKEEKIPNLSDLI